MHSIKHLYDKLSCSGISEGLLALLVSVFLGSCYTEQTCVEEKPRTLGSPSPYLPLKTNRHKLHRTGVHLSDEGEKASGRMVRSEPGTSLMQEVGKGSHHEGLEKDGATVKLSSWRRGHPSL